MGVFFVSFAYQAIRVKLKNAIGPLEKYACSYPMAKVPNDMASTRQNHKESFTNACLLESQWNLIIFCVPLLLLLL